MSGHTGLGPMLGHCAHLARERMDARLSRYDVTPAQAHAMLYLCRSGGTASQSELTKYLKVRPSTANGILDRMCEKGLVARSVRGDDARCRQISLTPQGSSQLDVLERNFQEAEAVLLQGFTPQESGTLRTLLERILHNLEEDRTQC